MDKQQAIDLLDNLIGMIEDNQDNDYDAAFRMAIDALKTQLYREDATSDLISRQAAIGAMDTWDKFGCDPNGILVWYDDNKHYVPYVRYDDMVHVIKSLPSVQPETYFCPNCGADMREENES